jgi:thiol reductant ABC exporter CydC subunit
VSENELSLVHELTRERRAVLGALGAGALVATSSVLLAASSGWLIVRAAQRPSVLSLSVLMGLVQLFALAKAVGRYVERTASHRVVLTVMARVRARVAALIEPLAPAGLGPRSADTVQSVIADVERTQDLLTSVTVPLVSAAVAGAIAVALSGALSATMALVLAGGLFFNAVLAAALGARSGWRDELEDDLEQHRLSSLADFLVRSGDEVVTHGSSSWILEQLEEIESGVDRRHLRRAWRRGAVNALTHAVSAATLIALIVVTAEMVRRGSIERSLVAVPALMSMAAFELISSIPLALVSLRGDLLALSRLESLSGRERVVREPAAIAHDVANASQLAAREVTVRYDSDHHIGPLSVDLKPGAVIALSGPSGSGKTSFARVLAKFLDPTSGALALGAASYDELASSQVRHRVGFVDDSPYIFSTTLRANLRLARPEATDEEMLTALAKVGLGPLLRTLPEGLDTELGGRDGALSGGERRRLGVAREFLSGRCIAIFDEPTEGLDALSAHELWCALRAHYAHGAVLFISHRDDDVAEATHVMHVRA